VRGPQCRALRNVFCIGLIHELSSLLYFVCMPRASMTPMLFVFVGWGVGCPLVRGVSRA